MADGVLWWVKPLNITDQIAAMFISSCTGMVLERSVGRYKGYSLLAVSITGLTGSIGAIQ